MSAYLKWQHQFQAEIHRVEDVAREALKRVEAAGFQEQRFAVELLLREALVNAVRHGSGGDARKMVSFSLWFEGDHLILEVADDGPGFNWREAACRQPDERAEGGRGLAIMRHYARQVEFNEKGNRVRLIL